MKLPVSLVGIAPAVPDYEMLRAALAAVQGATPTARRVADTVPLCDRRAALNALVTGDASCIDAAAASLGHCFALPGSAISDHMNEDERRLYRGVSIFLEPGGVELPATMRRAPRLQPRAAVRG